MENVVVSAVDALPNGELLSAKVVPFPTPSDLAGHRVRSVDLGTDRRVVNAHDSDAVGNPGAKLIGQPLNHQPLPSGHLLRGPVLVFKDDEQLAVEFKQAIHV